MSSSSLNSCYATLIATNAPELVVGFYDTIRLNADARIYLDNTVVEQQLKPAMVAWLREVFSAASYADPEAFEARQQFIGRVHARIDVPMHLVSEGASILRSRIAALIRDSDHPWESRYDAMLAVHERIDRAVAMMGWSYVHGVEDRARLEEAYRLFSLDQDLNLERERQRAGLMEWSQSILFGILQSSDVARLPAMSGTPFGLWVRHRAGVMFGDSPQLTALGGAITRVDTRLLPLLESNDPAVREEALGGMRASVNQMGTLLNQLFQGIAELENGRDALTRTMNRRFLPSILAREIAYATRNSAELTAMVLDVDHFKEFNDRFGHPAGDMVLRQLADIVADNLRSTDFVFRYGGEEFFVLLVESGPQHSATAAERVRHAVAEHRFAIADTTAMVTVSIGVAVYDGHPDPAHLVQRADDALYQAKAQGRNQVVLRS